MTKRTEERIELVALSRIRESPQNPRKLFGDLSGLAKSIEAQGIMQALVVRVVEDGILEIVFGHRRFRAAKLAGLKEVPVVIRPMTAAEALEQQLVENAQRADIHPLEQAESYERLHREFGYSTEKTMERLGVTKSHLYSTMKLLELVEPVRKAFLKGDLVESVALEIARRDGERLQLQALREVEGMGAPQAIKYIRRHFESSKLPRKKPKVEAKAPAGDVAWRVIDAVLGKAVEQIERAKFFEHYQVKMLVLALCERDDVSPQVLRRRGLESVRALQSAAERKLSPAELRGLLFEVIVSDWIGEGGDQVEIKAIAKAFGLNLREIESGVKFQLDQDAQKAEADKLFKPR